MCRIKKLKKTHDSKTIKINFKIKQFLCHIQNLDKIRIFGF